MPSGSCHCQRIRFQVAGEPTEVLVCTCSVCTKKAYLHWIVPKEDFSLLTARAEIATYQFGTRVAQHYFCRTCGVAPFYVPRSDPDKVDVNLRCVDGVDLERLPRTLFDGADWERAYAAYRGA
jgi:hypothetical protein